MTDPYKYFTSTMNLERWVKKLYKPSSAMSHSSKSCPMRAVSPSRRSSEQYHPSSRSTPPARARRRHKTFFGFSTRNASLGSLLSIAYGPGLTDLSRKHHRISSADLSSTTTIESVGGEVIKDREESLEDNAQEPETTTIYYHPPAPPPHAMQQQQQGQAAETREDSEKRQLLQDQLVEEAKKLARRRLERLGHFPEARASAKGANSSGQRRAKVHHDVDSESIANARPVVQTAKVEYSARNRSGSLPTSCPRSKSKEHTAVLGPDLLDFLDLTYLPYQPGHGTEQKRTPQLAPRSELSSWAYPVTGQKDDELPWSARHSIDTIKKLQESIIGLTAFRDAAPCAVPPSPRSYTALHQSNFEETSCVPGARGSSRGRTCPYNTPVVSETLKLPSPSGSSPPVVKGSSPSISISPSKVPQTNDPGYEQLVKVVHTLSSSVEDLSRKIAMMTTELTATTTITTVPISKEHSSFDRRRPTRAPKNAARGPDIELFQSLSTSRTPSANTTVSTASQNHPKGVIVRPDWLPPPPCHALPSIPAGEPSVATTRLSRLSHTQSPQQQPPSPEVTAPPQQQTVTNTTKAALTLEIQQEMVQCQTALSTLLFPKHPSSSSSSSSPSSPGQLVAPWSGRTYQPPGEKMICLAHAMRRTIASTAPVAVQSTPLPLDHSASCRDHNGDNGHEQIDSPSPSLTSVPSPTSLGLTGHKTKGVAESRLLPLVETVNETLAIAPSGSTSRSLLRSRSPMRPRTRPAGGGGGGGSGGEDGSPDLDQIIELIESRLTVLRSEWPQFFVQDSCTHPTSRTMDGCRCCISSGSSSSKSSSEREEVEEDAGLDKPLDTQLQMMVTRLQSELG